VGPVGQVRGIYFPLRYRGKALFTVDARVAEGQNDQLPALAADLANKLEPLGTQARTDDGDARDVASRLVEARDEADLDWIEGCDKDNGN